MISRPAQVYSQCLLEIASRVPEIRVIENSIIKGGIKVGKLLDSLKWVRSPVFRLATLVRSF